MLPLENLVKGQKSVFSSCEWSPTFNLLLNLASLHQRTFNKMTTLLSIKGLAPLKGMLFALKGTVG